MEVKSFDSFVARMGEGKGQILTKLLFFSSFYPPVRAAQGLDILVIYGPTPSQ
jgi:hypothetical protein